MKILQKFEISHENQFFFPFDKIIYLAICDIIAKKKPEENKKSNQSSKKKFEHKI